MLWLTLAIAQELPLCLVLQGQVHAERVGVLAQLGAVDLKRVLRAGLNVSNVSKGSIKLVHGVVHCRLVSPSHLTRVRSDVQCACTIVVSLAFHLFLCLLVMLTSLLVSFLSSVSSSPSCLYLSSLSLCFFLSSASLAVSNSCALKRSLTPTLPVNHHELRTSAERRRVTPSRSVWT